MALAGPAILLIDAYDSFSNNLAALIERELQAHVDIIKSDANISQKDFVQLLGKYDAVIVGPGPGSPHIPEDVGIIPWLWSLGDEDLLPVFGVCLGLQSLVVHFGGTVGRLEHPTHGIVSEVLFAEGSIFQDVEFIDAVRYHSLHAHIDHDIQTKKAVALPSDLWRPSVSCPDLLPLAWTLEKDRQAVLMGVAHRTKPFWAVQYHPESHCTNSESWPVISNWYQLASEWSANHRRVRRQVDDEWTSKVVHPTLLGGKRGPKIMKNNQQSVFNRDVPPSSTHSSSERCLSCKHCRCPDCERSMRSYKSDEPYLKPTTTRLTARGYCTGLGDLHTPTLVASMCDSLKIGFNDVVLLDSAAAPGRYSIIGVIYPRQTRYFQYRTGEPTIQMGVVGLPHQDSIRLSEYNDDVWKFLAELMDETKVNQGLEASPFWGGLIGYLSYELGLETLGVESSDKGDSGPPDLNMLFIERSVVYDRMTGMIWVQSILENDGNWVKALCNDLERRQKSTGFQAGYKSHHFPSRASNQLKTIVSSKRVYKDQIEACKEHIRAGDSYELCLTSTCVFSFPLKDTTPTDWQLFRKLRYKNPAPYAAYFKLGGVTVIGSSPERFLGWHRNGNCQLRPIKGTVKKGPSVMTKKAAAAVLHQPKEMAENLMILDLIRHDLHGITGPGGTFVRGAMEVEEYATVFHSVSIIEGWLRRDRLVTHLDEMAHLSSARLPWDDDLILSKHAGFDSALVRMPRKFTKVDRNQPVLIDVSNLHKANRHTGIDVLKASFPPGSMTGAPKVRSCALLSELEGRPRRIYSGVMGYMSVCGSGDFSVVIRTAWRWDESAEEDLHMGKLAKERCQDCVNEADFQERMRAQDMVRNRDDSDRRVELLNPQAVKPYGLAQKYLQWNIGAGGAITYLSSAEDEYEEMLAKLKSTSKTFLE